MPFGATMTTLTSLGKSSPIDSRWPRRKPCERPNVVPGLRAAKIFLYSETQAPSEMRQSTISDSEMVEYISPSVPFFSSKPAARAKSIEDDPGRRPTFTLISVPSRDSRRFCACAGPCEPHPITPICFTPLSAFGKSGNRLRPPLTTCSVESCMVISSIGKTSEVKRRPALEASGRASVPRTARRAGGARARRASMSSRTR
mmetsp:Transcript_29706/g.62495  ORF Transcript_29706/g.62495 Transcript_29706/m.62495 type:complete len:201 (+) Transcript_29706:1039-1641(+)